MKSKNLKLFKREIGQANHYLITILVGLDGVKAGVIEKNEEFSTSWNPKDKVASADRSREFSIKSAMSWTVDNLDMYFRMSYEEPKLINNNSLQKDIDKNNQSVYHSFLSFGKAYEFDQINSSIVDLMICWRNRLVHYKAENKPLDEVINLLKRDRDKIMERHNGMDILLTLERFEKKQTPTFKEIASMIKAMIEYVYQLDKQLIEDIDLLAYCDIIIIKYIRENVDKRLQNIYKKPEKSREKVIWNILSEYGLKEDMDINLKSFVSDLSKISYGSAKNKYNNGTFI
ncbi:hypothetical protein [Acetobacterium woodii]|uniref:Uncharacterized protein n=1 Tax=Acetobacterium woodii (strain ATCC 29683 / DSM 1030 / JCM 2381 / KCTC 1655 / WB1) TaxID=931626 RepID=H6LC91_ACEWD|nr:hypothetical protein [Acetobacterium woodii]AFA50206.1 hypothetical protein Awo_c34820 [Acetobacterium woodii DSM 1030]